jgi:hypothetical protein
MMKLRTTALVIVVACQPVVTPPTASAPATSVEAPARGDTCQSDIPDCEAACALREVHRTDHLDWFDRRCAAVVLGKNPDKAVPPEPVDASAVTCDPPYSLDSQGRKTWKRGCFD